MKVITETELREQYKQKEFTSFRLPAGTGLTPSAKQFLAERRIEVVTGESAGQDRPKIQGRHLRDKQDKGGGYAVLATGEKIEKKPEHLTHIHGSILVTKNHPRIKFRGKLDRLQALLINTIIDAEGSGYRELAKDLAGMLEYCRQIMSAEVTEKPLAPLNYLGLSNQEIRGHSHHPDRFYGISHILPKPESGRMMAQLNILRTEVRALELSAMDAFYDGSGDGERSDILQSLNRLSSLVYVYMLQLASGRYQVGS